MTALQFVCSCKASAEHIEALLEFGANPNTTSPGVDAPLLLLIAGPHVYIPDFLKAAGARLDTNVTYKDGDVPIARALKLRKFKAAEQMLDAPSCKYDPKWKDKDGATCLQSALRSLNHSSHMVHTIFTTFLQSRSYSFVLTIHYRSCRCTWLPCAHPG